MTMTKDLKDLINTYDFDEKGRIQNAGKFEGETIATIYYYNLSLECGADETVYIDDVVYDYFEVSDSDIKELESLVEEEDAFDWLSMRNAMRNGFFRIFTDDSGFVRGEMITEQMFLNDKELEEAYASQDDEEETVAEKKIPALQKAFDIIEGVRSLNKIAEAARDFVHLEENWNTYKDLQTSNSMDIPVEFMNLCEAVESVYGELKIEEVND